MNIRHSVIDSPLGELTVVADGDALTGVYFRHHWHRPAAGHVRPAGRRAIRCLLAEAQRAADRLSLG